MAEKRKGKKRKEDYASGEDIEDKPSKDEFQIAKWIKKNVPIKKTKFYNQTVEYFTGRKAVDALLESKWGTGETPFFKSREAIVSYLQLMLEHKFYHRARKIPVSEQELKAKKKDKKKNETAVDETESQKEKEKGTDAESSMAEGKREQQDQPEKEKRKKKIRLEMHNTQQFVDGLDAYVWIYDPIPFHYWIIGTLFVLGAIGICLFPLWPASVRVGVYYLSVAAAGFLVSIIVLAIIRLIVFCLIWIVTLGRHHLWILPNLTEDVGFFASFWPLYKYEYKGNVPDGDKKKKKDKDSDAEEPDGKEDTSKKKSDQETQDEVEKKENPEQGENVENVGNNASESESESSQRSSTGKDFEMVDQQELES